MIMTKSPFPLAQGFYAPRNLAMPMIRSLRVLAPNGHTVGYIVNSVHTKANGTMSAARVYDLVGDLIWREFFSRSPRSSAKSRILMFQKPPRRFPCSTADPKTNGTRKTEPQFSPPPSTLQRRGFFCQQPLFSFVFLITIFTRIFVAETGWGTGSSAVFSADAISSCPAAPIPSAGNSFSQTAKSRRKIRRLFYPCKTPFRAFISRNFQQNPSLPLPLLRDAGADDTLPPPWPGRHRASP